MEALEAVEADRGDPLGQKNELPFSSQGTPQTYLGLLVASDRNSTKTDFISSYNG